MKAGASAAVVVGVSASQQDGKQRAVALVCDNAQFVWRCLRRWGVPRQQTDDASQQVFVTAMEKLSQIVPGRERAFLAGVAFNVARRSHERNQRSQGRRDPAEVEWQSDPQPGADDLLEQRRARELLQEVLDQMPFDQRTVFVLFEIEALKLVEIAELLSLPLGTISSRLRRGREFFHQETAKLRISERGLS